MSTRFLHPGAYLFGTLPFTVQTVLGSCVALCAWHPQRKLLAVSHAMLPEAPPGMRETNCRYADHVLRRLLGDMRACATEPAEYRYLLAGGTCQLFDERSEDDTVGSRILAVFDRGLESLGVSVDHGDHCGGRIHRKLVLNGSSGEFRIQNLPALAAAGRSRR